MSTTAIVSYDGTPNDADAIALARTLADAGTDLILAYVRHSVQSERAREELAEHEAEAILDRGATTLGLTGVERRVVVHASTSEGLRALAAAEDAELVVFGSEYRTARDHITPQKSTERMLDGGPVAVAIAPAGYASVERPIRTIGLLADLDDAAAIDTAHGLARHFDARVTDTTHDVDLLIVGSRREADDGRVLVSSRAEDAIEAARAPVLVLARGVALGFHSPLYIG